jgi:hypothetical protein
MAIEESEIELRKEATADPLLACLVSRTASISAKKLK